MPNTKTIGDVTECYARRYLAQRSLTFKMKNFHCRFGEIDLVMLDSKQLVFVEVRYRRQSKFASALESITWQKQQKLIKSAQAYLQTHKIDPQTPCRFDIIALTGSVENPQVEWLKNAFY